MHFIPLSEVDSILRSVPRHVTICGVPANAIPGNVSRLSGPLAAQVAKVVRKLHHYKHHAAPTAGANQPATNGARNRG